MQLNSEEQEPSIWSESRRSLKRETNGDDHRIAQQHDYDRLLFSTPVRRLADKTQVFPLDPSDAVRTRLTHSHEVANLARSMGNRLLRNGRTICDGDPAGRVAHILATIGLGHDLGNPPFGHQGEAAIGHWFQQNLDVFSDPAGAVPEHLYPEFTAFEGNAQTLRILTRLQVSAGNVGLDLTAGTLAAIMKYTVSCDQRSAASAASKKYGYFESEHDVVFWVGKQTGIQPGERHPLTWIMEAADDIAYSILDIEDAMKKGMLSPDDVFAIISGGLDSTYEALKHSISTDFGKISPEGRSIGEIREIKASYLRTNLIRNLIGYAVASFEANWEAIDKRKHARPLLDKCDLCKLLKNTAFQYVFSSTPVRCVEAEGAIALESLMTFFWNAISDREETSEIGGQRRSAAAAYGWSLISDNYRQVAIREAYPDRHGGVLPMRYRELRLLTDMVSGMTDGFARALHTKLVSAGHIRGK